MGGFPLWLVAIRLMAATLAACLIVGIRTRRSHAKLCEQNRLFDAALNDMTQGLSVFNKAGRLVLSNNRYIEMSGLSPVTVKPGITARELLELRRDAGTFFKIDPEHYTAELKTLIGASLADATGARTCRRASD